MAQLGYTYVLSIVDTDWNVKVVSTFWYKYSFDLQHAFSLRGLIIIFNPSKGLGLKKKSSYEN